MRLLVISLLALFLSLALLISGNAFLATLLGLRFGLMGVDAGTIGLVMVGYSIGFVIGARYGGIVIRRVGHIRAFAVYAAVAAVATLVYPMTDEVWVWWLLRVIGGITIAALFVTIESWFSAVASNANRGTIFAMYQVVTYLAAAGGQLLIALTNPESFVPLSLAAILLVAAIIPLSLSHMHSPELSEPKDHLSLLKMYRMVPLGVVGAFVSGVFIGSFYALVPLFASLTGLNTDEVSLYMFAAVMAAMVFAWPIGWLCDRFQRSHILLALSVLGSIACLANDWLAEDAFVWRVIAIAVCMGLSAAIYPVAVAITNDLMDATQIIAASTGLLLSYSLGAVVGPLVFSFVMAEQGPSALFLGLAVALLLMAFYTLLRQQRRPPIPVAEQEDFVSAIPDVNPIPDIDPRNEAFVETPIEELFKDSSDTET
ncbi:MFS transporter [Marinobacter zhejiangensis]|uniref:Predicted arabinose efflux permease, MFS family n=1 Tax=Marinobacter zhejiangensis TaxID=488535 RepID=A0A1I4P0X4_9GAMM|nr:MFS transporter [Marinobacter zhejiangensis]SFM21451.1 Predicted arabinose efflux permease, MFS family [Marinobacter zhejiangensis]